MILRLKIDNGFISYQNGTLPFLDLKVRKFTYRYLVGNITYYILQIAFIEIVIQVVAFDVCTAFRLVALETVFYFFPRL